VQWNIWNINAVQTAVVPVEVKSVQECILIPFKTRAIWRERVCKVKRNAANHSSRTQYTTEFSISELDLRPEKNFSVRKRDLNISNQCKKRSKSIRKSGFLISKKRCCFRFETEIKL
jgi:hypothetical protein